MSRNAGTAWPPGAGRAETGVVRTGGLAVSGRFVSQAEASPRGLQDENVAAQLAASPLDNEAIRACAQGSQRLRADDP
ncbi:MAG: hypothetical protein ACRELX_08855, partial [Longimicrobiales bacterium]